MPQQQLLELQPADRLRALLEIATTLAQSLTIDDLLQKVADTLLTTFRQADRCFVITRDEPSGQLIPRVIKTRRPQAEGSPRFSRTIVRNCLESQQAYLSEDASSDSKFALSQSITDFRILSVMCAPLVAGDKAIGVIQLDSQDRSQEVQSGRPETADGRGQPGVGRAGIRPAARGRGAAGSGSSGTWNSANRSSERSCRSGCPEVAGYQFFAQYKSALTIGGDYYDFIPLPDGKLGGAARRRGRQGRAGGPAHGQVLGRGPGLHADVRRRPGQGRSGTQRRARPAFPGWQHGPVRDLRGRGAGPGHEQVVTILNAGHMPPLLYCPSSGTLVDAIDAELGGPPLGLVEGYPISGRRRDAPAR